MRDEEVVDAYTTVIFDDVNNDGIYAEQKAQPINNQTHKRGQHLKIDLSVELDIVITV